MSLNQSSTRSGTGSIVPVWKKVGTRVPLGVEVGSMESRNASFGMGSSQATWDVKAS